MASESTIAYDTIDFDPSLDGPSGVLYVFPSTATTNGYPGGRSVIGDICPTEDPDAHFCSQEEIENAWGTTGVYFNNPFPQSWVDYYTTWEAGVASNCGGWNLDSTTGKAIQENVSYAVPVSCVFNQPVACCKQMP